MIKELLKRWSDWTGDRRLDEAINAELRRQGYAVHAAQTREVRLVAIERPGWVQVHKFRVQTTDRDKNPITLLGLARDDGRKSNIDVLLTIDPKVRASRMNEWSEGLIRRR